MLLRVRDEMHMTTEAYQALYCSSIAFGMRKALQAEQGKSDLQQDVDELKADKVELEHQIVDLKQRAEQADRRAAETRLAEERKHTEEIAFLKKTNQQLKVGEFGDARIDSLTILLIFVSDAVGRNYCSEEIASNYNNNNNRVIV